MSVNCNQPMNIDTEIRKLQPAQIYKLSTLLEVSDSWKKLMALVPTNDSGKLKFRTEHFGLIEHASQQQKRGCAEIFLDEWSTMGRKRPTLKLLMDLLVKAELYRAADYIAIDILNWEEGPRRPNSGPAAQIDLSALLLESRDDIVESTSSISGDVYIEHSFVNKMGNPEEDIQQNFSSDESMMPHRIPAFLKDVNFSSFSESSVHVKSSQQINSTSSESLDSKTNKESRSITSEIDSDKISAKLPRCLLEMSSSSFESQKINESESVNKSLSVHIPRMVLDFTDSQ